ncbi:MAG: hypothetical protein KF764_17995 [Labilithrix sp.]|nr:hypothetical protein [Labilithrix sp.]
MALRPLLGARRAGVEPVAVPREAHDFVEGFALHRGDEIVEASQRAGVLERLVRPDVAGELDRGDRLAGARAEQRQHPTGIEPHRESLGLARGLAAPCRASVRDASWLGCATLEPRPKDPRADARVVDAVRERARLARTNARQLVEDGARLSHRLLRGRGTTAPRVLARTLDLHLRAVETHDVRVSMLGRETAAREAHSIVGAVEVFGAGMRGRLDGGEEALAHTKAEASALGDRPRGEGDRPFEPPVLQVKDARVSEDHRAQPGRYAGLADRERRGVGVTRKLELTCIEVTESDPGVRAHFPRGVAGALGDRPRRLEARTRLDHTSELLEEVSFVLKRGDAGFDVAGLARELSRLRVRGERLLQPSEHRERVTAPRGDERSHTRRRARFGVDDRLGRVDVRERELGLTELKPQPPARRASERLVPRLEVVSRERATDDVVDPLPLGRRDRATIGQRVDRDRRGDAAAHLLAARRIPSGVVEQAEQRPRERRRREQDVGANAPVR